MIHVTPRQTPHSVCASSELSNPDGWIDVNHKTLQHVKYPNVWSLGDCSSLPTSKTAVAVAAQNKVLYDNLVGKLEGDELPVNVYDGYTSCPLITSGNECILAEFDYKFRKKETFWFDQTVPSK